jgi:hypothetical protein
MTKAIMIKPWPAFLWVRAVRSSYIPDMRRLACARNSFFFRIWGLSTHAQVDQFGLYLMKLECREETRLDKVWGPADQVGVNGGGRAIDINHPIYGTRISVFNE